MNRIVLALVSASALSFAHAQKQPLLQHAIASGAAAGPTAGASVASGSSVSTAASTASVGAAGTTPKTAIASAAPTQAAAASTPAEIKYARDVAELQKFGVETKRILAETPPTWVPVWAIGSVAVVLGVLVGFYTTTRGRLAAYNLAVVNRRLDDYTSFVKPTELLALAIPRNGIDCDDCAKSAKQLRSAFYTTAAIILSEQSRVRYSMLVAALAAAATCSRGLRVPAREEYAVKVTDTNIKTYRAELHLHRFLDTATNRALRGIPWLGPGKDADLDRLVHTWWFGLEGPSRCDSERYRDFVLLQLLASRFRNSLSRDIRGRKLGG